MAENPFYCVEIADCDTAETERTSTAEKVAAISTAPQSLSDAANGLISQLGVTILYSRTRGTDYDNAHGLSVYLPRYGGGIDPDYTETGAVWAPRTTWDEFLEAFTQ